MELLYSKKVFSQAGVQDKTVLLQSDAPVARLEEEVEGARGAVLGRDDVVKVPRQRGENGKVHQQVIPTVHGL